VFKPEALIHQEYRPGKKPEACALFSLIINLHFKSLVMIVVLEVAALIAIILLPLFAPQRKNA